MLSFPFLWQLLLQFFDRLEEVAEFFDAGEDLVGAELQEFDPLLLKAIFNFGPFQGR